MDIKENLWNSPEQRRKIATLERHNPILRKLVPWVLILPFIVFVILVSSMIINGIFRPPFFEELSDILGLLLIMLMCAWISASLVYQHLFVMLMEEAEKDGSLDQLMSEA